MKKVIRAFVPAIAFYLVSLPLAWPLHVYERIDGFDIPMHMLGGCIVAWCLDRLHYAFRDVSVWQIQSTWLRSFVYISTVALITIFWELYEFYLAKYVTFPVQMSIGETIGDQLNGLVGAVVYCLFASYRSVRNI